MGLHACTRDCVYVCVCMCGRVVVVRRVVCVWTAKPGPTLILSCRPACRATGYNGAITIQNSGSATIADWRLNCTFDDVFTWIDGADVSRGANGQVRGGDGCGGVFQC